VIGQRDVEPGDAGLFQPAGQHLGLFQGGPALPIAVVRMIESLYSIGTSGTAS